MIVLAAAAWAGVIRGAPPPSDLERAYGSRRVALVVGIDVYDDPALGNLRFASPPGCLLHHPALSSATASASGDRGYPGGKHAA